MSRLFDLLQGIIEKVNSIKSGSADWNQNDPNGEGYIANRTHYTEVTTRQTLLENYKPEFDIRTYTDDDDGTYYDGSCYISFNHEDLKNLQNDDTILVEINGAEYTGRYYSDGVPGMNVVLWHHGTSDYFMMSLPYQISSGWDMPAGWVDTICLDGQSTSEDFFTNMSITIKIVDVAVTQLPMQYIPYTNQTWGGNHPENSKLITAWGVKEAIGALPHSYDALPDRPFYYDVETREYLEGIPFNRPDSPRTVELEENFRVRWDKLYEVNGVRYSPKTWDEYGERSYYGNASLIPVSLGYSVEGTFEDNGADFVVYEHMGNTYIYIMAEL